MSRYMFLKELTDAINQVKRTVFYVDDADIPLEISQILTRISFELKGIKLLVEELDEKEITE